MYVIETTPFADRCLEKLEKQVRKNDLERLLTAIRSLATEPRPKGVKKIRGRGNSYRIRVGNYRVVYEIRDKELLVMIVQVARRNESTYIY